MSVYSVRNRLIGRSNPKWLASLSQKAKTNNNPKFIIYWNGRCNTWLLVMLSVWKLFTGFANKKKHQTKQILAMLLPLNSKHLSLQWFLIFIVIWKTPIAKNHLGTKHQWQNANTQNPNAKNALSTQYPKPQTQKSVAFHTLAFCLWHSDQTPHKTHPQITSIDTCSRSSSFLHYLPAFSRGRFISCSGRIRSHVAVIVCRYFTQIQRRFICLTLLYTQLFRCTGILEKCYNHFAVWLR